MHNEKARGPEREESSVQEGAPHFQENIRLPKLTVTIFILNHIFFSGLTDTQLARYRIALCIGCLGSGNDAIFIMISIRDRGHRSLIPFPFSPRLSINITRTSIPPQFLDRTEDYEKIKPTSRSM